ncbi:MAG TPA: DUF3566 domain-containing protein [Thermobifida alba]|nr:DUF3566 domain-containing protein [Thermobifida alba]
MSDNAQRESAAVGPSDTGSEQSGADAAMTSEVDPPETETFETAAGSDAVSGTAGPESATAAEEARDDTDSAESSASEAAQGDSGMAAEAAAVPPATGGKTVKTARKAHLTLSRIEPWSVMKFSFVISLVCFIVLFVAVAVLYTGLASLGVFDAVTELVTSLTEGEDGGDDLNLNPAEWFSPTRVLGYTALIGALNVILITALATIGAMLYNLAADLVGGLDVTLSETE